METKQCSECLSDMPAAASRCAHCGSRTADHKRQVMWLIALVLAGVLAYAGIKSYYDNVKADAERQTCREYHMTCP